MQNHFSRVEATPGIDQFAIKRKRQSILTAAALIMAVFALLSPSQPLRAQDLPDVAQGFQPYVGYHGGQLDSVNTMNGGLTVRIPLVSYPQLGSLALSYSVYFNSFGFQDVANCIAADGVTGPLATIPLHNGCTNRIELIPTGIPGSFPLGPRLIADQTLWAGGTSAPEHLQSNQPAIDARFYVIGSDNSEHPLAASGSGYRSIDESGYMFTPTSPPSIGNGNVGISENAYPGDTARIMTAAPGTITDSHGLVYTANSITDPDGNSITLPNSATAAGGGYSAGLPATDSVGRSIPGFTAGNVGNCPTIANAQYQPLTVASLWSPPGSGSGYLFCYASVLIATHYVPNSGPGGVADNGNQDYYRTVSMLQSIVLPNGTFWGFIYDSANPNASYPFGLGRLMTMIYPTGGSVSYTYAESSGLCTGSNRVSGLVEASILPFIPQVATRTMVDSQGTTLGTWNYTFPITQTTGSILSPTGDLTVLNFVGDNVNLTCGLYDAGEQVYQGNSTSGPLLRSTVKTYTFPVVPVSGTIGGVPASAPRIINEVTTLQSGSSSSVQSAYASTNFGFTQCDSFGNNCTNSGAYPIPTGEAISKTYLDYSGSILKQDTVAYQWQQNSAYFSANMLDLPYQKSTLNPAGAPIATTTYTYDETAYSPGGVRGDATTVSSYLNTAPSSSPTSHTGWNSQGMKVFTIDPDGHTNSNGHTTDYTYSSDWCNSSVVVSTENALGQYTSGTYDCTTGLVTSVQDPNARVTSVAWDSMRRLTSITYPQIALSNGQWAQPQTTFCYNDGQNLCSLGAQNAVTRTILASPDPAQTTSAIFDGFGREIHRETTATPQNIWVDTTYDADGRVSSVTNPYYAASAQAGMTGTSYTYDALNRKGIETEPDGNVQQWCFDGVASVGQSHCNANLSSISAASWVDQADETGRVWQRVSDALGRLTAVLEPGTSATTPTLQTNYSYDPLGNLLNVNQLGTSSETPRVRTFTYDSLSRLICAANPENTQNPCPASALTALPSGVLSYAYDPNGNVLKKTDARGISTSFTYDFLNRVTNKSYNDGITPSVGYTYDSSSISGATLTVGRLTSETIALGNTTLSQRSPYAYDALGRVNQLQECTPANCASTQYQLAYTYDLAGNITTSTNGIPSASFNSIAVPSVQYAMGYDVAGRLNSLTSSWSDATAHPGTPLSGTVYTASGHLQSAALGLNSQTGQVLANLSRTFDNRLRPLSEVDTATSVLQSPATESYGSISISGTEGQGGTHASGTITITGSDGTHQVCSHRAGNPPVTICNNVPDTGSLVVTIDSFVATANYSGSDTDQTVAASLATALSGSGSPVTATSSNNVVTITSNATGSGGDYAYSITNGVDFVGTDSGAALAGGGTAYDTGTLAVTVNGTPISVPWGQGDTPDSMATKLANAINTSASNLVKAIPSQATQGASIATVGLNSAQDGASTNYALTCTATDSAGQSASFSLTCTGMSGGANSGTGSAIAYQYSIPQGTGYQANGNLVSVTDSVTGSWSYQYDNLNRLTQALGVSGSYAGGFPVSGVTLGWSYDSFGNRLGQSSTTPNLPSVWVNYGANNQATLSSLAMGGLTYDNAGDVKNDGVNQYAYDAEGRICAVWNGLSFTGYVYDGEGNRVAKGSITGLNCNFATNGFSLTSSYVNGLKGEPLTEMKASGAWDHSNVYAGGALLATYSGTDTYFAFNDWLGTKRAELRVSDGCLETYASLPFGDKLTPAGNCPDATEQHFTGKERDTESGNDYFGARYYASNMGRWMSPDWNSVPDSVPYANLSDPQSLNLYSYTRNNPLSRSDPDGHCDIDGEHHGGVWCFLHKLGLTETQHEVANDLRTYYQGLTYTPKNGSPIDVAGQSDADIIKFNQDHREEFANAHWAIGLAGPIAAGASGAMLGANGTQVTSKTLWQDGSEHIDVENPNPGQRPGQIHYQDSANNKYIYDVKTGQFEGLSNSQSKQLLSKPEVQQAIQKGLNYLGEGK